MDKKEYQTISTARTFRGAAANGQLQNLLVHDVGRICAWNWIGARSFSTGCPLDACAAHERIAVLRRVESNFQGSSISCDKRARGVGGGGGGYGVWRRVHQDF